MFNKFSTIFWLCIFSSHLSKINTLNTDNPPNDSQCLSAQKNACYNDRKAASSSFARSRLDANFNERSLVLLKPDAVQRKLVGKIIQRFEDKGLKLVAVKLMLATREMAATHYIEHENQPFFENLMKFMTSQPLMPMIWQGPNAVKIVRLMLGVHDPTMAVAGTIRGDFSSSIQNNVIHGSDTIEAANREIDIWFKPHEIPK